jgi:multidrug efflux system outer membrane protein
MRHQFAPVERASSLPCPHPCGHSFLARGPRSSEKCPRECGHGRPGGLLAILLFGLSACTVGPNYKRPDTPLPPQFHSAAQPESAASIADAKWIDLFDDDVLKQLVTTAIDRNFDLRIAAERVEEARASLGVARANQYPFLDAQALGQSTRSSTVGDFPVSPGEQIASTYTQAGVALSWEIDFWGRLRRLTEAARAQYLATEEGRRAALVSLVSQVMTTYFQLLEQDLELEISRKTRDIATDNLRLVKLRHDRGAATGLDVSQAQQLLYTATSAMAAAERGVGQTEDALSLLLGGAPTTQPRGKPLYQFPLPPQLPAGLPSALLERRPDILQAEQNLVAANAQIGAARALYFPTIELTGFFGAQSRALTQFFTFPARMENIGPSALLPIFHAGQIRQQVRLTQAQQREMLATYQKAVYSALRDVSDALIAHDRTRQQREQQEQLVAALSESVRLSTLRYQGGLDSYLQVLDAQRSLFQGQLQLAQLRMLELQSVAQLYRALGGGWQ